MWDPLSFLGSYFKTLLEAAFEQFRDDAVAPALAGVLIAIGIGLILVLVVRVVFRSWQIRRATSVLKLAKGRSEFAQRFALIDKKLDASRALGHAWRTYKPTLVFPSPTRPGTPELRGTASPQSFFNAHTIDESWRIYRALPNLFVGTGLLLTFAAPPIAFVVSAATRPTKVNSSPIPTKRLGSAR